MEIQNGEKRGSTYWIVKWLKIEGWEREGTFPIELNWKKVKLELKDAEEEEEGEGEGEKWKRQRHWLSNTNCSYNSITTNSNSNSINSSISGSNWCFCNNYRNNSSKPNNRLLPFLASPPTSTPTYAPSAPSISSKTLTLTLTRALPLPLPLPPPQPQPQTQTQTQPQPPVPSLISTKIPVPISSSSRNQSDPGTMWSSRWRTRMPGGFAIPTLSAHSPPSKTPAKGSIPFSPNIFIHLPPPS